MADPLFDEWRAYQKLLDHDYMYHGAFFGRLKQELQRQFQQPVAILDLGCGDASPIRTVLESLAVSQYCGIDQSETALSMAAASLASLDIPSRLLAGDLLDILPALTGSFDVIIASFSLHHFKTADEKKQVLRECQRLLNPSGLMVVIDVFQAEDEDRDEYLRRWIDFARNNYLALDHVEVTSLVEHVLDNDFPETLLVYQSIGRAVGFEKFEVLMHDKENFNHLVTLGR